MITVRTSGNFKNTESFFKRALNFKKNMVALRKYGEQGVEALSRATPKRSGATASSWEYEISYLNGDIRIDWKNTNEHNGANIAILLQYGHGTGTGGYVKGIDYVNPAMKDVFQQIADDAWKEITK